MNNFTKEELEHIKVCLEDNYEACSCGQIEGINRHHLENQRIVINKTQSLIDNYGTIKISRRKCPICDSDFNDAQLTNDKKFIYECSNEQCSYFHGFGVIEKHCNHDWSQPLICMDNTALVSCNICGVWK